MQQDRRRRRLRGYVAGGLLALVGLVAFPGSVVAADIACKRSALTKPPLWTGSGTWNGEDLVLVDTIRRSLLPSSVEGRAKPEPHGPLQKALVDLYPVRLAAGGDDRMVLQTDANRFLVMDRGFATLGNVSTRLLPAQDGSTIEKVFDWVLAGDDIVGFADIKFTEAQWGTGPVRFSTKAPRGFQILHDLAIDDASRKYHRLGYTYIANLGDTAYYLLMGNGIHLWKYEKGRAPQDLGDLENAFPSWKAFHTLPSFVNPQDYSEVMEWVEEASMPTGLYGWVDPASGEWSLYLVSRERKNGKTQWLLSKLNPSNGRVLGTAAINSNANHLFVVPGARQWAVVEKGPALGLREQEVKTIFTIPVEKVRNGFKPGRAKGLDLCQ